MRMLTCGYHPSWLWFSDTARRLVVMHGGGIGPYLQVYPLDDDAAPVVMDSPPLGKWVVGYSDGDARVRLVVRPPAFSGSFLYRPGADSNSTGLSVSAIRAVVADGNFPQQLSQLRGYSLSASGKWQQQWHREATGFYQGPVLYFQHDTRFVIRRSERTRSTRPRTRTHLVVCEAADGGELAVSSPSTSEVTTLTALGRTLVVALDIGPWGGQKTTFQLFADGDLTVDPTEVRLLHRVAALVPDPLGRFLLSASGTKVTVWDPATWKPARTFDWKIGRVTCLAVSLDGTVAAAGGDKGKVAVWDVD